MELMSPKDAAAADSFRERLTASADQEIVTTAITPEEQMRGWLSAIHGQSDVRRQVKFYDRLVARFRFFADWRILPFDAAAAKDALTTIRLGPFKDGVDPALKTT